METPYMEILSLYWNGHQGLRLNIKMSYQYRDPHVKDNTVSRPSYFQHGNPHTLERRSLYWAGTRSSSLRWRHNDQDGVSNHQPHGCLLNRLFRRRSNKTSKLRVTGLCVGNSPGPVNFPHKGPVTRKMFPFDDVIMLWKTPVMSTSFIVLYSADSAYLPDKLELIPGLRPANERRRYFETTYLIGWMQN